MKLTFFEKVLFKAVLKEKRAVKILVLISEIYLILFGLIFLYLYVLKKQPESLSDAIFFIFLFFFVFVIRSYQNLIRKLIRKDPEKKEPEKT